MNNFERSAIGVVVVLALLGAWMFHKSEVEAATERATLQATLKQQGDVIAGLNQQIQARDKVAVQQDKSVDQSVAAAKTQAQIAALIGQMAGLKQPPIIIQPAATKDGVKPDPDAPSYTLSSSQGKQLLDFEASCKKCENDLAAAVDVRGKQEAKITALTKEKDEAVDASKGGSGWSRFKRAGKWFGVGSVTGGVAVAILILSHRKQKQ